MRPAERWQDRMLRLALRGLRTLGGQSDRVRAACDYAIGLIDNGARRELDGLIRLRVRSALGLTRLSTNSLFRRWRAIPIDARTERLTQHGGIAPKDSIVFPSVDAPLVVSVVIPCYNYGAYLDDAISAAKHQSIVSNEIIVVDDGSTDPVTLDVLGRVSTDPDVRVIRQENRGLPAARNRGIEAANGEYICCLDADDRIAPTYLEQAIALLETDRSVGFAYSWLRFFGDSTDVWQACDFDAETALVANYTTVVAVFRRDDCRQIGGFDTRMNGGFEDWEFWIRLASLGRRGRCIAHPLFFYRRHGPTMLHKARDNRAELRARMRSLYPVFYENRALRRRIGRLTGRTGGGAPGFGALSRPHVIASDARPGLVVVVTGLMNGGAHSLLHDVLKQIAGDWRITVLTTGDVAHPMEQEFRAVTPEIFHLHGFLEQRAWLPFLNHVIDTRRCRAILSSDSLWMLESVRAIRDTHPHVRIVDVVHNHVPTSTFRTAIRNSAAIDVHVAVSEKIAQALAMSGVAADRIVEIANGVDPELFDPIRIDRDAARRELGVGARPVADAHPPAHTNPIVLAWIGRMSEEKRPLLFLDLVAALLEECEVDGLMFGDGPLSEAVDSAIASRGLGAHVRRQGHVPRTDIVRVYAAADLVVMTSRVEGMPLVVLEALAMGCPVAATDVGDIGRIVRHGINGFLVSAHAVQQLAQDVRRFARDPALQSAMRREAIDSMRNSPYHVSRMGDAYARVLDGNRGQ